jgi:hypothetical protein
MKKNQTTPGMSQWKHLLKIRIQENIPRLNHVSPPLFAFGFYLLPHL